MMIIFCAIVCYRLLFLPFLFLPILIFEMSRSFQFQLAFSLLTVTVYSITNTKEIYSQMFKHILFANFEDEKREVNALLALDYCHLSFSSSN